MRGSESGCIMFSVGLCLYSLPITGDAASVEIVNATDWPPSCRRTRFNSRPPLHPPFFYLRRPPPKLRLPPPPPPDPWKLPLCVDPRCRFCCSLFRSCEEYPPPPKLPDPVPPV